MSQKRIWQFSGFKLIVMKIAEPGKYSLEFIGGIDYQSDGTIELRGERKKVQSDLDYLFTPKKAMSNSENRFELNFMLENKAEKFEKWLEKIVKDCSAVPENVP